MDIRQSDLAAFGRCAQQKFLYDQAKQGLVPRPANLSRTVFGTSMHHVVQVMETMHVNGQADVLATAKSTFAHYWDPENLPELAAHGHPELVHGIDEWLARDTYGAMRAKGLQALEDYYELLVKDDGLLLALEVTFRVPIDLDELGWHYMTGTLDRLALRRAVNKPYVSVEDFKTGKTPTYLRYNLQFSVYCWATTQQEFWTAWDDGDERWQTYARLARRGRWIDLRENKIKDAGWRGDADYARMKVAAKEYVRANQFQVFPLTVTGDACLYCPFKNGICGGVAVPDENEGRP